MRYFSCQMQKLFESVLQLTELTILLPRCKDELADALDAPGCVLKTRQEGLEVLY